MSQTIIGVFDSNTDAQQAAQALIAAGVRRDNIRLSAQAASGGSAVEEDKGFWANLKEAFGFGDDDEYEYREAARRGGTVVSVAAEDAEVERVTDILQRHKAINLDERTETWRREGWAGRQQATASTAAATTTAAGASTTARVPTAAATAATARMATAGAPEKLQVAEEQLHVGKRAVARGGVRIHTRVTERPVQEQVNLREEHVTVQRTPVDRPVAAGDALFKERTIEATEVAEQAVVAKQAKVIEEVTLNKDVRQRTETVRDTVKRQDVEVEQLAGDERFGRAYAFADELAGDAQYRGRQWTEVEPTARRSFEQRNPGSKWDDVKEAIRGRYDKARAKA